jgi:hypothetical protein
MTTIHRTLAVLTLSTKVPALITQAQAIVESVTGNPAFPNAAPLLASITSATTALVAAETTAQTKVKGAAQARNQKRAALVTLVHQLKSDVQQAADADPANAEPIILGAGLAVRKPTARSKATFIARRGTVSGTAQLVAKAVAQRASYEWQYSVDGKTWTMAPSTLQARTTVEGLTPATTYTFRYRAVTKAGEGDWSSVTTLVTS